MMGRSLQRELPLGIGLLLSVAVLLLAGLAYREVRRSAVEAASERLDRTTAQLAQLLTQSARTRYAVMESTAALPAIRDYLRAPQRAAAPLKVLRELGAGPLVIDVELWDPSGRRLTQTATTPRLDSAQTANVVGALREGRSAIGRFELMGDSVVYALVSAIGDKERPAGFLVERRRLTGGGQGGGGRALADLIGEGASLAIGNAVGDLWTDFSKRIPGPPADVLKPGLHEYQGDSGAVFARSARVAATPWQVVVDFPRAQVLERSTSFLTRVGLITLALLVTGVSIAWFTGRWITRPLRQVTEAAEAIAAGRSAHAPDIRRSDEIGRLTGAFNIMADRVSQSHAQLEAQVAERTAALQDSLQELEAFSYTVSHDLRAPLRAMQGFAQALQEDYDGALDDTGRDYARRVVEASKRMDVLIQDLLGYSRLSREQLSLGSVNVDSVLEEVARIVEGELKTRGGTLEIAAPLGRVHGNARLLHQVLMNLVGNAIKFVPAGRAPVVRVRTEAHDGVRRVWVEDNGIGIEAEHQQRIFRVFERLHGGETYPGTGIGLAIVRRGAERMGGAAGVESTPGQGSRFWVDLPIEGAAG